MAFKVKDAFDFNTLVDKKWECPEKGLQKILIEFNFKSMTKATEISKCLVEITDVKNLNDDQETNYLRKTDKFWIQLGTSLTPIDYYVEQFIQKMYIEEKSRCTIKTLTNSIEFTLHLIDIEFKNYLFQLNCKEMYELAKQYKENGCKMFRKYPKFAHEYFCRAAKCLISFKPFDNLTEKEDGISSEQMRELLEIIQLNIAACLIKEQRFDDVIYLTEFVENNNESASEKAIYRRALAFYNLKNFEKAKETLEKCKTMKESKELTSLYGKILNDWKAEKQKYNNMVKKMFI